MALRIGARASKQASMAEAFADVAASSSSTPATATAAAASPFRFSDPNFMSDPRLKGIVPGAGKGCVACGGGGDGRFLHRLKHQGIPRYHCSSCILLHHKGMYCFHCLQVYRDSSELGEPASWQACCKCQRLSHLECARKHCSPTYTPVCIDRSHPGGQSEGFYSHSVEGSSALAYGGASEPQSEATEPSNKKQRTSREPQHKTSLVADMAPCRLKDKGFDSNPQPRGDLPLLHQETLAAAKVVAALAAREASDAKMKAMTTAAAAVKAAARAKVALDNAYRAGREEAKVVDEVVLKVGRGVHVGGLMQPQATNDDLARQKTPRNPRTAAPVYKRRTLSAIVASEASRALASSVAAHGIPVPAKQQHRRPRSNANNATHLDLEDAPKGLRAGVGAPPAVPTKQQRLRQQFGSNQARCPEPSNPALDAAENSDEGVGQHLVSLASSQGLTSGTSQSRNPQDSSRSVKPGFGSLLSSVNNAAVRVSQGNLAPNASRVISPGRLPAIGLECPASVPHAANNLKTRAPDCSSTLSEKTSEMDLTGRSQTSSFVPSAAKVRDTNQLAGASKVAAEVLPAAKCIQSPLTAMPHAAKYQETETFRCLETSSGKLDVGEVKGRSLGSLLAHALTGVQGNAFRYPFTTLSRAANNIQVGTTSSLHTSDGKLDEKVMKGRFFHSGQSSSADLGRIEIVLPGVEAVEREFSESHAVKDGDFCSRVVPVRGRPSVNCLHDMTSAKDACCGKTRVDTSGLTSSQTKKPGDGGGSGIINQVDTFPLGISSHFGEANCSRLISEQGKIRCVSGGAVTESASKLKNQMPGVHHYLMSSCLDNADKPTLQYDQDKCGFSLFSTSAASSLYWGCQQEGTHDIVACNDYHLTSLCYVWVCVLPL